MYFFTLHFSHLLVFCEYSKTPLMSLHAKSFLQRLQVFSLHKFYLVFCLTQLSSLSLFVFTLMKRCDCFATNADQLRASLSLMELIKVKWLKGFLFVSFLFGSFFSSHQSSFNIYSTSLMLFLNMHLFDKTRGSLVLRFLKLSLVQYMYCISGTLSSSGDHCAP